MRIGELAAQTGTTTRALRFYEEQGLLKAPRSANGYREYGPDEVRLVTEIRRLTGIGMSLDETRPFVACLRAGHASGDECADSIDVYRRKLSEVDDALKTLRILRAQLLGQLTEAIARPSCCTSPSNTHPDQEK